MVHDQHHALEFAVRRGGAIDQELGLSKRDATEILHCSRGEVGDRHQVDLVTDVGNGEIVTEELEGVDRRFHRPLGQVALSNRVDNT